MKKILCFSLILFINHTVYAQSWSTIPNVQSAQVLYTDTIKNVLYMGGGGYSSAGKGFYDIAIWNGTSLDSFSIAPTSYITNGITRCNNKLYISDVYNFSSWNDTTWTQISGVTSERIVTYKNEVYAKEHAVYSSNIVKWDGIKWTTIGTCPTFTGMKPMIVYNNELYVIGNMPTINGITVNGIGKWDGTKWTAIGTGTGAGVNGYIYSLVVYKDTLYASGDFNIDNNPLSRVSKWDGTKWLTVGLVDGRIGSLAVYNNALYAGGNFISIDNVPVNNIAKWDGTKWTPLGVGLAPGPSDLAVYRNQLYTCGSFTRVDGKLSKGGVAIWDEAVGINDKDGNSQNISVYPNPSKDKTIIEYTLPQGSSKGELVVYNLQGQELKRVAVGSSSGKVEFNSEELQAGTYIYQLKGESFLMTKKMVIIK